MKEGKFIEEIVPVHVDKRRIDHHHKLVEESILFRQDEGVRQDTNIETLAKLKPAFSVTGSITAGNSSQMSDGAAALWSWKRKRHSH